MPFRIVDRPMKDLIVIEAPVFVDERGITRVAWAENAPINKAFRLGFVQDNDSVSVHNVIRGLHYQGKEAPADKFVRCAYGEIFDVAVDLRINSPTFSQWFGLALTDRNGRQIFIPSGFAHGFAVLSDVAVVEYKWTGYYDSLASKTIAWNDPEIGIAWPIESPLLSEKDQGGRSLKEYCSAPDFFYPHGGPLV